MVMTFGWGTTVGYVDWGKRMTNPKLPSHANWLLHKLMRKDANLIWVDWKRVESVSEAFIWHYHIGKKLLSQQFNKQIVDKNVPAKLQDKFDFVVANDLTFKPVTIKVDITKIDHELLIWRERELQAFFNAMIEPAFNPDGSIDRIYFAFPEPRTEDLQQLLDANLRAELMLKYLLNYQVTMGLAVESGWTFWNGQIVFVKPKYW